MTSRRQLLGGLGGLLSALLGPEQAWSRARPLYGGSARLTVPVDTTRIDPHDPGSLSGRLFGASLFDGLYAQPAGGGAAYPTLASALPETRGAALSIELRPGLRSARGTKLDAKAVALSLERSRPRSLGLADVARIRTRGPLELELTTTLSAEALALALTDVTTAIVPPAFDPSSPDCTGALRSLGAGITRLARNGWAARGGSYLDTATLTTGDLRACLRAFEVLTSDVGFLGSGLHRSRSSAKQFALGALGWLVLVPGRRLGRFGAPGVLDAALGELPRADFAALGVDLPSNRTGGGWSGPAVSLLVDAREPWLLAIASEVARAWDSPAARVQIQPLEPRELALRAQDRDFDCALSFLGTTEPNAAHRALLGLSGLPAPTRPLGSRPLEDAVRHLPLALLGQLSARGFYSATLTDLVMPAAFDLANARFLP